MGTDVISTPVRAINNRYRVSPWPFTVKLREPLLPVMRLILPKIHCQNKPKGALPSTSRVLPGHGPALVGVAHSGATPSTTYRTFIPSGDTPRVARNCAFHERRSNGPYMSINGPGPVSHPWQITAGKPSGNRGALAHLASSMRSPADPADRPARSRAYAAFPARAPAAVIASPGHAVRYARFHPV